MCFWLVDIFVIESPYESPNFVCVRAEINSVKCGLPYGLLMCSNFRFYVCVQLLYACYGVVCGCLFAKVFPSLYQVFYVLCKGGVVVSDVACGYKVFVCGGDNVGDVFCGCIYGREGV